MAETVVNFVLGKLGELLVKEAQSLGEVGDKVERVKTELTRMKCYLTDADSKRRKGDARAENWLNELRDVAYRIEDATDTHYVEIEDKRHKAAQNFLERLKRLVFKDPTLDDLHKLGTELDDIIKVLEEISGRKVDYHIEPQQERDGAETLFTKTVPMPLRRNITYQDVDETEVVGLDAYKNNICKLILDQKIRRRAVLTIVGPGGIGKTTLARMVYESVRADFNFHIMLPVSQQYNPTNLLGKILGYWPSHLEELEIGDLISNLKDLLSSKRYLIILDDVWVTDLWNQYLKDVLPDNENGSRVLITSRFTEVAQSIDPIMKPYELKFLNDEDSRNLLIRKALPDKKPGEKCPDDLLELVDALSMKCKGLPLSLIVLGGILSTKDHTYSAWDKVLRTMDWPSDGNECINILAMSYEDMPGYLKTCFLYLASFPEDYEIYARSLIRMWVAEGFIPQQERKSMEEIAEDCLEQLFQRSIVQVSRRYTYNGSIKYCRVQDLLRDFAMHQAGKENFVTVFRNPQDINDRDRATRRVSLQSCRPQLMEYVGPKTRSLFFFGHESRESYLADYSAFRLLRVLEIDYVKNDIFKLRGVDGMIHLKYLTVRCYDRFRNYLDEIDMPEQSFSRLKNLETLDFRGSGMLHLPTDLWTITTLRHVLCEKLPQVPSTADLPNLQTLKWMSFNNKKSPYLTNLRKLGLHNDSAEWDVDHAVPHLLRGLPSLTSLEIISKLNLPIEIVYPRALPNYQNLRKLYLNGNWSEGIILKASLFPPQLIQLSLVNPKLPQDPMPELGKLNNLKALALLFDVYNGKQMICPTGFPVLQSLVLWSILNVEVFTVAKGVMPNLKNLKKLKYDFYYPNLYDIKLEMPPELMHLIN